MHFWLLWRSVACFICVVFSTCRARFLPVVSALRFALLWGGRAERYLLTPLIDTDILIVGLLICAFVFVFAASPNRRIASAISAAFRAPLGYPAAPSGSTATQCMTVLPLCVDLDGARRVFGYYGDLRRVLSVLYFPRAERAFCRSSAPCILLCGGRAERYPTRCMLQSGRPNVSY